MLGILDCCRIGIMATVTALSAVPIIATKPSLAIFRARFVPTVGSPVSSKSLSSIFRPLIPPLSFHSSAASFAPFHSHWPSELSWPLCALTTAILMGPSGPSSDEDVLPGALQAVPVATARTAADARTRAIRDLAMKSHLVVGKFSELVERTAVDVLDVPVSWGGHGFVHHRDVQHRRSAPLDRLAEHGGEISRFLDEIAIRTACPAVCGEVGRVRVAVHVTELAAEAGAEAGRLQVRDRAVGPVVHHQEDHRQALLDSHRYRRELGAHPAVADECDDHPVRLGDLHADG